MITSLMLLSLVLMEAILSAFFLSGGRKWMALWSYASCVVIGYLLLKSLGL